ncbi:HAMP domain-containing sensor histidine kinase [Thermoanaerobacterium sp. RBIITD]|uniref:HAMP domain-containing sensor histidine kinase n=1 Tax=Thermoanaerobacterium sp. RBIITD TaxID=1550240 RepID=UPI000BB6AC7C|nr:Signal transduction histidine kinase [Thermoanaerobacterium sp. RBIITD]
MKGIRGKLFMTYIIITGLIFLLFYLSQVVFIEKIYTYYKVNQLKSYSSKIINSINKNNDKTINELIDESNAKVSVITDEGNIILGSHGNGPGGGLGIPRIYLNTDKKISVIEFTHPVLGVKYLAVINSFTYKSQGAKLIMSIPMSIITDTAAIFKEEFFLILLISIIIIIIVSSIMSKKLTKPINNLKKAAHDIASGNLNVKIDLKTSDEIEDLAASMNDMAVNLNRAEKFRKDLIANITHDLKTPLGLIKGYCEMLLDFYGDDKHKRDAYLNTMIKEVDRMSKMIDNVLSLSKLQSGLIKLNISSFNLKSLVEEVVNSFEPLLREKNINIKMDNIDVMVNADKELIRRVFINIISNSIKSIKDSGVITITSMQDDGYVKIKISDTGKGMSKEDLQNIFKKFYKGEQSGTGLGLAIVKEILDLHGSKYFFESEINKGTSFFFTLNIKGAVAQLTE